LRRADACAPAHRSRTGQSAENHFPAGAVNRLADSLDFSLMIRLGQVVHLHKIVGVTSFLENWKG
jgi:hypothetical protein